MAQERHGYMPLCSLPMRLALACCLRMGDGANGPSGSIRASLNDFMEWSLFHVPVYLTFVVRGFTVPISLCSRCLCCSLERVLSSTIEICSPNEAQRAPLTLVLGDSHASTMRRIALGPPVVPFYQLFWGGVPLLK